ncbi:MAG: hypothetical protein ACI9T8_000172 [Candidatus Saccharimonadales bacterium]|jgi:hypothetical protein
MKLQRRQTNKGSKGGLSTALHIILTAALPLLAYILVRLNFGWVAVLLIILSKWRMFAVKLRHWPANFRANAVDIFVGVSFVIFMVSSDTQSFQLLWSAMYAVWLLVIKPQSSALWVGVQALISQALALTSIFLFWSDAPTFQLVFLSWGVGYLAARHFLTAFDEAMSRATAYSWAFFVASIAWLSGHWLIFYGPVAQPALLLSVLGYGLASIYYLEHTDKLSKSVRRQFILVMLAVVLFLVIFSDWKDKTI